MVMLFMHVIHEIKSGGWSKILAIFVLIVFIFTVLTGALDYTWSSTNNNYGECFIRVYRFLAKHRLLSMVYLTA